MSNAGMISYLPNRTSVVGYVSNNRLIAYSPQTTTAAVRAADGTITTPEIINPPVIRDIRRSNSVNTLTNASELTDTSNRSITLYNGDINVTKQGNTVILPSNQLISADAVFVRNPVDASLLLKPDPTGSDVFWVRTNVGTNSLQPTLYQPFALRGTSLALPLFVSNAESVIWNNGLAPVGPLGVINPASISHLTWSGAQNAAVVRTLTPPIEGRFIVNTPQVGVDPKEEGWIIHSLDKINARSVLMRSYRLSNGSFVDRDLDGMPDFIEMGLGSDPSSPDSDDDDLSDGDELAPYYVIDGQFTWQEAVADATARGGRVAVFRNRDEYLAAVFRFRNQLVGNLWLGASDITTESSWLWLNGTALNRTQWLLAGVPSWSAFYNEIGGQAIPWSPGMPNNMNNADALVLRTDMLFEDRPVLERRGYLIEYPRTNPSNRDSDGDGMSDGDELANGTNPMVGNPFAGVPTPPVYSPSGPFVNFAASGVAGNYEGLVFDPEQGHTHRQTISLSNRGSFSSAVTGLVAGIRGTFRGAMNPVGYYLGPVPGTLGGMISMELWLVQDGATGQWMIRGRAETNTGVTLGIELRRTKHNSANRYPLPGRLTMFMPMTDQENPGPKGDAVAVGSINSSGVVALSMYHPDNGRSSFSGPILHGDLVALRSLSSTRSAPSVVLGPLNMNDPTADRHFGGSLRYYSPEFVPGSQFQEGFSQIRTVSGARYVAPPRGVLALRGFRTSQFNSQFNLEGGDFGGLSSIGTWSVSNSIVIPPSPAQRATATFAAATGLLTYRYTGTDTDRGLVNAPASGFAVHQQLASVGRGSAVVRGYYTSAFSNGGLSVTPNDGTIPDMTVLSPVKQKLFNGAGATQTYTIDVRTQGAWQVVVPAGLNWATVAVVGADAATPLVGNGNGTVTITVGANETTAQRVLRINIAGVTHTLTQDYRSNN
ncbi:MAG: hypothetical protein EAZ81_06745 [Verrucomicrobia bacterium]|nr:MAG: hypothetical protein EAZ81_06745 [Verrucomicrobiota bacterium]